LTPGSRVRRATSDDTREHLAKVSLADCSVKERRVT
jgi:hypothetical protein